MQLHEAIRQHAGARVHVGTLDAAAELNRLLVVYGLAGAAVVVAVGSWLVLADATGEVLHEANTGLSWELAVEDVERVIIGRQRELRALTPTTAAAAA